MFSKNKMKITSETYPYLHNFLYIIANIFLVGYSGQVHTYLFALLRQKLQIEK